MLTKNNVSMFKFSGTNLFHIAQQSKCSIIKRPIVSVIMSYLL